jgi:outer membrane autotransporter protein
MSGGLFSGRVRLAIFVALTTFAVGSPGQAQINNYGLLTDVNSNPGNAVEFDTRTNAPIGSTIATGGGPKNAAFSPGGRFAYTTNIGGNSVSVIDVASRNVVATIPVSGGPASIVVSPNGQFLYTANQSGGTVSVISTATNQVVGSPITVGSNPSGIAASPDGNTLYVTNFISNTISVINATTKVVTATIPVGAAPNGVTVTPDGTKVYVANGSNGANNQVTVINAATNTVITTITVGNSPLSVAASPDGSRVVVTNQDNTVYVINTATNTVLTTITVSTGSLGVAYTPDGRRLYVSGLSGADIIDPATNTVVGSVSAPALGNTNFGNSFIGPNLIVAAGGPLSVTSDAALTGLGFGQFVDFNGGTLQAGGAFSTARTISLLAAGGTIDTNGFNVTVSGQIINSGGLTKAGLGTLVLSGANTYAGGTTVTGGLINFAAANNFGSGLITLNGGGLQWATGNTTDISSKLAALGAGGGTFDTNGNNVTLASGISGIGGLTKAGAGTLALTGNNSYSGGTTVTGGLVNFAALNNFGTGTVALNGGGVQWASGTTTDISSRLTALGASGGIFDTNGNNVTLASAITGSGGLTKQGTGTLTLTAANSYSGGTTVSGGTLAGNTTSLQGNITNNAAVVFNQTAAGTYAGAMSGTGSLTLQGGGVLNLTGNSTYTGGTAVMTGTLAVNGSVTGNVAVGAAGTLGGNGTIGGNVVNAGTLAPGNSIGLLTVNGFYTQMAGSTYQVEVNRAGQGDRLNVGGAAAIEGGTVQVVAAVGSYDKSTTYTIVSATGGVSGTYSGVTSNFAFLTPTLSYDANDVFLTLALGQNAFTPTFLALTLNQRAVGIALNPSVANTSGDFATVIGALAGLNIAQGPVALDAISGQPYANVGTMNVNNSALFMNALGQQMANARGASAAGQRQALAQACEIESCDGTGPLSAWASALGGLGSVLGDGNASTLTYNFGGAAAGIDYRLDPRFLVGIGVGYTHGTQWVNSFMGQGWSDSVSVAAYGSFTQAGFYLDALAGYAYFNNQLQRQILIPGLQQRTATGSTGANQFLGQIEGGYKVGIYAPAAATITPFGRFQISSVTQNAFSESGAQSLSLNVAQQTTNSQRTTIGADLASSIGLGNEKKLDLAVRLGWQHEFADTGRPITAAFAGAPGNSFTVFGATPTRDAAVVGLQASTNVAAATQVYLRYDGGVGGGTDNHALMAGLRMSW